MPLASPSDDLLYQHIVEIHKKLDTILKVVVKQQDMVNKLSRRTDIAGRGRAYLRDVIRKKRELIADQKRYIVQLENELRLRGLE